MLALQDPNLVAVTENPYKVVESKIETVAGQQCSYFPGLYGVAIVLQATPLGSKYLTIRYLPKTIVRRIPNMEILNILKRKFLAPLGPENPRPF